MRLLLLAPPGGGKGTQGQRLAAELGVRHISAGDLLRAEAGTQSPLGRRIALLQQRGELVPDDVVFDLLTPLVVSAAAAGGYILDGFPRSLPQARAAAELGARLDLRLDAVIYLEVPEPVLVERLVERGRQSGRSDDTPEVILRRLRVFATTTDPLVDYYRDRGILLPVDGDRPADEITSEILRALSDRFPAREPS